MAQVRNIITIPDTILTTPASIVENAQEGAIQSLIADMKETVIAANGIGLAAPQVGESLRIIVINNQESPYALINPEIIWQSNGETVLEEGCLSVPDTFVPVKRPGKVRVRAISEKGENTEILAKDMLSKIIQHEIDHINGILITNYLSQ